MENWDDIEKLNKLVTEMELPRHDFALFGLKCPICGKSDRIHKLETPDELQGAPAEYRRLWTIFSNTRPLVVCKFCRQVLSLSAAGASASSLMET